MSGFAVGLVLTAAVLHAVWNYHSKRAAGGMPFVFLSGVLSSVVYAPIVLIVFLVTEPHLGGIEWVFIAGTTVLHLVYFLMLNWGYQVGDLSLVYPIARGTGPVLATCIAIAVLGERPSAVAILGAVIIAVGIFLLAGDPRALRAAGALRAVMYALLTGIAIAGYTVWDKVAVSDIGLHPLVMMWISQGLLTSMLLPFAAQKWAAVRHEWRFHKRYAFSVAVLSPLAYLLVLTALTFSPVSYVAPMRESSTLAGTVLGTRFLQEGYALRRSLAAGAVVCGVIALGLG